MPSDKTHPDERCSTCHGSGEIEVCQTCASEVDNCECDTEATPDSEMEECPECEGTGDNEPDE